jgi:hypothetical protein
MPLIAPKESDLETTGDEVVAVENPPIAANSTGRLKRHLALFIESTISRYVRPAVFCRILRNPHRLIRRGD